MCRCITELRTHISHWNVPFPHNLFFLGREDVLAQLYTQLQLILDNADELDILPAFLPPHLGGHVIITTRAIAPGRFAQRLLVETFPQEHGILFLLRRATT